VSRYDHPPFAFRLLGTSRPANFAVNMIKRSFGALGLPNLFGLLTLVAMILWFCEAIIFRDQVPLFRDLGPYFYPLRFSLAQSLISGEMPLWDRHLAQGFPLLAALQPGVFYPPHLLLGVLSLFSAVRILFVLHFMIAGVGAYKLLREWQYPCFMSVLGALLFTLGGTIVSLSNLLNHFQSAVWLPWILLVWERLLISPNWSKFLTFTSVLVLQLLAGSPEIFAMTMGLVFLDGLRVHWTDAAPPIGRIFTLVLAAVLVVIAASMVQLLPTAELFLNSRRQQAIPMVEAMGASLNPLSLINLLIPDKEIDLSEMMGIRFFFAQKPSFLITHYLGGVSLFGICLWLYYGSLREKILLFLLITGTLVVALGGYTPVYPILFHYVPMVATFRYTEKFFFIIYVLLVFVTVKGLGNITSSEDSRRKGFFLIVGAVCLGWLALYLVAQSNPDFLGQLVAAQSGLMSSSVAHANALAAVVANIERQMLLSFGVGLLLCSLKLKRLPVPLAGTLLVCLVYADLASVHKGFLFPSRPGTATDELGIAAVQGTRNSRLFYYPSDKDLHPNSLYVTARPSFDKTLSVWFQNLLPNVGVMHGIDYLQEMDALGRRPYTDFLNFANRIDPQAQVRLLRAFNVGHVVSFRPLTIAGLTPAGEFPEYYSWLYKVDQPVPRAYVVVKSTVEKDPVRTLQRLADNGFDPMAEVILDQEIPVRQTRSIEAKTNILSYRNTFVTIETETNDNAILVFLDSHYPGWKAYVDGRETSIVKANHFYRAVQVPTGRHFVEFKYEPISFKIGLIISLLTFISIAAISLVLLLYKRESVLPRFSRPATWIPVNKN
jgi:Bacterial membrane protein YfhO